MKKLICTLALTLVSITTAHAMNALCMPNRAGGTIVLTNAKASGSKDSFVVFSTTNSGGSTLFGKWLLIGKHTVMIKWPNGSVSTFRADDFSRCTL